MSDGVKIDRRDLQAKADANKEKRKLELAIQQQQEVVNNARLYGSEQDVYKEEAKLNDLENQLRVLNGEKPVEYTPPVLSGNVQNTGKDVVKDAVAAYNSESGTFDNLLKTLKDAGYNDDSIETIIKENKLEGKKATEWVKNRGAKRAAEARGETTPEETPPEVEADEKEAEEKVDNIVNEPPAHTPKGIDVKKDATTETDGTNTADENTVAGVNQSNPIDNQLDNQATEDRQNTTGGEQGTTGDGQGTTGQDDTEAKNFWKKWRAGALRAYPMLQSIGDAISRNARMTADRAALLTGGERDTGAYDPIQVQQVPKSQLAFADAEAGNFDTLKEAVMSGEIDIDKAAQALNMTPESLQERFNRSERSDEADVESKEVGVEQSKEDLTQSILQNKQRVRDNILFIDEQIRQIDKDINALEGPDFDAYNKVLSDYVNNYTGLQTIGSTNTKSKDNTNNLGGGFGTGELINKFVSADVRDTWTRRTGSSDTGTSTKDVLALAALPKGEEYAQMAFDAKNAANAKLIEQLQQQKARLVQMRDQANSAYEEATGETATRLNYKPKTEEAK